MAATAGRGRGTGRSSRTEVPRMPPISVDPRGGEDPYARYGNQRLLAMNASNMSIDSAKNALDPPYGNPMAPRQLKSRAISQDYQVQEKAKYDAHHSSDGGTSRHLLHVEEKYIFLLQQVGVLSKDDDGILTNKKLQHIEDIFCTAITATPLASQQPFSLKGIMNAVVTSAITDELMTSKVSVLTSSVWFSRTQIDGQRMYKVFMEAAQEKVSGVEQHRGEFTDKHLVNLSTLLTDIFAESKVLTSEELAALAHLVLRVMGYLLVANTNFALKRLNVQLMTHGKKLNKYVPEKLEELSLKARKMLLSKANIPNSYLPWLMLLSDTCLYRFEVLPNYLQQFYGKALEEFMQDESEAREAKALAEMESSVKKINISHDRKAIKSDSSDRWSIPSNGDAESKYAHSVQDDVFDDDHSEYSATNGRNNERKPRPILGAGSKTALEFDPTKLDFSVPPPPLPVDFEKQPPSHSKALLEGKSSKHQSTIGQDDEEYWMKSMSSKLNIPRSNQSSGVSSISSRLDLNSWRQTNVEPQPEVALEEPPAVNEINLSVNMIQQQKESIEDWIKDTPSNNWTKGKEGKKWGDDDVTGTSNWVKSKSIEDDNESEKTKLKNKRESGNWRSPDVKKELPRRNSDERESNWRKPQSEPREVERKSGQWGVRKQESVRSPSDDSNKSERRREGKDVKSNSSSKPKRDALEVPRKASYWSHDDRCDKDY